MLRLRLHKQGHQDTRFPHQLYIRVPPSQYAADGHAASAIQFGMCMASPGKAVRLSVVSFSAS